MNNWIKKFNLVEVIIAMGIIVVCITTILGLFSAGMKVTKEATSKSYTNFIFEQVSGFIDTNIVNNGSLSTYFPTDKEHATNATYKIAEDSCTTPLRTLVANSDTSLSNFYFDNNSLGVMKVKFTSDIDNDGTPDVTDFEAAVRTWIETTSANAPNIPVTDSTSTSNTVDLTSTNRTMFIEITWPITELYQNRDLQGNSRIYKKVIKL